MDKRPSYKHFPTVGAFYHKFLIAPSETTDRIKKVREVQKWDRPPRAKFGKNHLRGYTPLGKIYTENSKFLRL